MMSGSKTATPPLVSVGLPTYNRASLLAAAIQSVLAQTYQNLQLVVSDNASNDGTEALCRSVARDDGRLVYVRQPVNRGAIANFNEVFRLSTGDFYMWLSDDDVLEPEYVSRCVQALVAREDHSIVCGRARLVDGDRFVCDDLLMHLTQESPADRVLAYFRQVEHNSVFYGVMRRSSLERVRLGNSFGADWLLIGAMASIGKIDTVEGASLTRSVRGISGDTRGHVESLGLSRVTVKDVWLRLGLRVLLDIVWKNPVYRRLSLRERLWLGIRAADGIWGRRPMPAWWSQYRRLRRLIKALGTTHVTDHSSR